MTAVAKAGLFQPGDEVRLREFGWCGIVQSQSSVCDFLYVLWSDGNLGVHYPCELKLIRRVENPLATIGYPTLAKVLQGDHPFADPAYSDEAEIAFLHLMAEWQRLERVQA